MESIPEYDHHIKAGGPGGGKPKPPWQQGRCETLKTVTVVLLLVIGGIFLLGKVVAWLSAETQPKPVDRVKEQALSPDGKLRAFTYLHVGPPRAFTGVKVQDSARKPDPTDRENARLVFAQEFDLPLRLSWDDAATLRVVIPSDADNAAVIGQTTESLGIRIIYVPEEMFKDRK